MKEKMILSNHFGFMAEISMLEPIFCIRQIVEKYREKCMGFLDLEKAIRIRKQIFFW